MTQQLCRLVGPVRWVVRNPDVERLALVDGAHEGSDRLVERGGAIGTVGVVDVDVIEAKVAEAVVERADVHGAVGAEGWGGDDL